MSETKTRTLPGPVLIDIAGLHLTAAEKALLRHPLVGGIILFSRNYASPAQLAELTQELHSLRETPLLISVDHEGGRVQRFRAGFTRLPPMAALGRLWQKDEALALVTAKAAGHVLGAELRAHGVDLSFTPVLDLDYGSSTVIGDRAFHAAASVVSLLAGALLDGLAEAGMWGVGKHFPGHGYVVADSHVDIPRDERGIVELARRDLVPFNTLAQRLGGIMPAHVIYEQVDQRPAGFSNFWLQTVLRGELQFKGAIFSDDLSMAGAKVAGDILARADGAWRAGCDVLLVCNDPAAAERLLHTWQPDLRQDSAQRLLALMPKGAPTTLSENAIYQRDLTRLAALETLGCL